MSTLTTSQSGIRQVSRAYDDVDIFKGILKLDNANINQFDPMITGYAQFYWIKLPPFMTQGNPELTTRFRNYTEKGHTSFDGIQDMAVDSEDMTGGIAGNQFKMVTNVKDDFDTFTMKVYELQGSPVRESIQYWVTGVRDYKTGYATYHGLVDTIDGGYTAKNHTGELLYVVTDPSGSSNGIEYAALITNIMPTKIPKSHLNLNHGEHGLVQIDLEFTGVKYESQFINEYAKKLVAARRKIETYDQFRPQLPEI